MSKPSQSKKQFLALGILRNSFIFLLLGGLLLILIATFDTYREDYFVQINIEERNLELDKPFEPNVDISRVPGENNLPQN